MAHESPPDFHKKHRGLHKCGIGLPVRGLLQLLIIKSLSQKPMRGIDIKNTIKDRFGFEIPSAVIYMVLKGLEERGFVYSTWDKISEGNPIKVYTITSEGKEYLEERVKALHSIRKIVDFLIE